MKKAPLYSRAPRASAGPGAQAAGPTATTPTDTPLPSKPSAGAAVAAAAPLETSPRSPRWRAWFAGQPRALWATVLVLFATCVALASHNLRDPAPPVTQKHIDAAVRKTLEKEVMPSPYTRALAAVAQSVVRVQGDSDGSADAPPGDDPGQAPQAQEGPEASPPGKAPRKDAPGNRPGAQGKRGDRSGDKGGAESNSEARMPQSTGTGVVIVDDGTILTNLHVVAGQKRLRVTFADGHESDARLVAVEPDQDLAVLRAVDIPDDLKAATMRSTADLLPGEQVVAVGFPFGIGPSTSAGVVSGLKREFRSPGGKRTLSNLIQFDAAANPGNSGGPLVTMDGAVVGIVTAILNPSEQRTFIGIGFAVPIESAAGAAGMPPF